MKKRAIFKNSSANFLGKLANRGIRILLVPLQIGLLGDEAFGLLGVYALLSGLLAVLDLGLSYTSSREVARYAADAEHKVQDIRDLVRTFELPYWLVGTLGGGAILIGSDWFTDQWLTTQSLPRPTVLLSVKIIGLLFVARWPVSLYQGFLYGLQRQVAANTLSISIELINGIGSVAVLLARPRVEAYFLWQLVVGCMDVAGHMWLCWHSIRERNASKPRFRLQILHRLWRYALGINLMSILSSLSSRSDSLILSKLLPIDFLGYYSLAQRVPTLVGLVSGSILPATAPIMVAHHENRDTEQLSRLYHRQTRWLAFLSAGIAFPIAAYSQPILRLWTQSDKVADASWLALSIVAAVSALEITSNSVNQTCLTAGLTGPALTISTTEGLVIAAGTLVLAPGLGISGAAISWAAARVVRYFLYPVLADRVLLKSEARAWFFSDTLPVFGIAGLCFGGSLLVYELSLGKTDSIWLWIPFALFAGSIYAAITLGLDFLPDWRSLPLVSTFYRTGRVRNKA